METKIQKIESLSGDSDYKSNLAMLKRVGTAIDSLSITKESDEKRAIETGVKIKKAEKDLKAKLKYYIEGAEQTVKRFKAEFKPTLDLCKNVTLKINNKLIGYRREVERIAEEARVEAHRVAEENRKKLEAEEKAKKKADPEFVPVEVIPVEVLPEPELQKTVASKSGSMTYRKKKEFRITDFTKIPDDYKLPDNVQIRKMMNANIAIPGVEYYEGKVPSYGT